MEKENIENLIDKIVIDYFRDELLVYELDKKQLFKDAWNQNYIIQEASQFDGINQAGMGIETILGCISTLVGTVKTIFELKKYFDTKTKSKKDVMTYFVSEKWLAELQLAGLSPEKAQVITNTFSNDLEKLIKYDK